MKSPLAVLAPPSLGRNFRLLLGAGWTTSLADGVLRSATPLLIASLTEDPLLIALGFAMADLPILLFGLLAGVMADRYDRRQLLIIGNVSRILLLAALVGAIATDQITIAVLLAAIFLIATAETLEDSVAGALVPMIVPAKDLGLANARFMLGWMTMNQFAGPSIGAVLFATATVLPYGLGLVLLTAGAVLVMRLRLDAPATVPISTDGEDPDHPGEPAPGRRPRNLAALVREVVAEIREGVRWLWQHDAVRTLALLIFGFNLTFGAAWSVLVLYAKQRLGLPTQGYGLLISVSAVGGVLGTLLFTRLERRFALATLLRAGLIIEALTHLVLAWTTSAAVAMATLFVFGVHASVWGTLSTAVRQRAVPRELQGRVGSMYQIAMVGGLFVGGLLGGVIARWGGITAPYWYAFVGSVMLLAVFWRGIARVAHADERAQAAPANS